MNQLVFNNFRKSSADWYRDISLAACQKIFKQHATIERTDIISKAELHQIWTSASRKPMDILLTPRP